ncbi:MAG TPA: prenyltransferase/squalene oxidase repeat-containing protein [Planctomycetota bacterium]|nr:prenyltransferase/squalene oxidase repeat-containing protein [Planctomycetota bacterium]
MHAIGSASCCTRRDFLWRAGCCSALAVADALPFAATMAQDPVHPPGVTGEVHAAIGRGLDWLARNQANDGSWRSTGVHGTYPAAMTGMAGMALIGSGSTPTRGRLYKPVRTAYAFLMKHADRESGLVSLPAEESRTMYGHGFATLFLASVYGMEEDVREQEKLKRVLDNAVGLIAAAQSPAGGWNYTPTSGGDEGSVTITQVQALRACRMAGIVVDKKTIDRAIDYIRRCQNPDGSIKYRLGQGGAGRAPITAAGIAVLYNAGVYDDRQFVEKAVEYCKQQIQVATNAGHHYYAHLYWSQALYQRGGADWNEYFAKMSAWLVRQQKADGSWDGDNVGPVYGTAIALTILQLPYAHVPIYLR